MITVSELHKLAPNALPLTIAKVSDMLNLKGEKFGCRRGPRLNHFLAMILVESEGLTDFDEDLYYTTAERIREIFGNVRTNGRPELLLRNPKLLANTVYGGAWGQRELGNVPGTDDGWEFRGSGPGQLTGRANFQAIGDKLGLDLIGKPELARDPGIGTLIALQFARSKNIWASADQKNVEQVTKIWTGAYRDVKNRRIWRDRARAALPA